MPALSSHPFSSFKDLTIAFVVVSYLHASIINVFQALELLPSTIRVRDILTFLENVLENIAAQRRHNQVLKSLSYAENLSVS